MVTRLEETKPSQFVQAFAAMSLEDRRAKLTDDAVREIVIQCFQGVIAPFYERLQMIERGDTLKAVSLKPLGIWYANTYALALKSLGKERMPFNEKTYSAAKVHEALREKNYFYAASGSKKYWVGVPTSDSPVGFSGAALRMKEGVSPAEAYQSFREELSFLDCDMVYDVAVCLALLEILGKDRFDKLANGLRPLAIGHIRHDRNSFRLHRTVVDQLPITNPMSLDGPFPTLVRGQTYYVTGVEGYTKKHLHGESKGVNLLYLGEGKFTGLGFDPKGISLREVALWLLKEYNRTPIAHDVVLSSQFLEIYTHCTLSVNGTICKLTFEQVRRMAEGKEKHPLFTAEQARTQLLPSFEQMVKERGALDLAQMDEATFMQRNEIIPPEMICAFRVSRDKVLALFEATEAEVKAMHEAGIKRAY